MIDMMSLLDLRIRRVLFFLFITSASSVYADSLRVYTSSLPPYSYIRDGRQDGYASLLVKTLLKNTGHEGRILEYPLSRMKAQSIQDPDTLIYPLIRHKGNEDQYLWIGKITDRQVSFFRRRGEGRMSPADYADRLNLRIGVVRESLTAARLKAEGYKAVEVVKSDLQNIRKLLLGRIDLIAQDELVLAHSIEEYNRIVPPADRLSLNDLERIEVLPEWDQGLYIALSPGSDLKLAEDLRESYRRIIDQGLILEVAHWWTNEVEQKMLGIYRDALDERGFLWHDYTVSGGAGSVMERVFTAREEVRNYPHAVQNYMGPSLTEAVERFDLLSLERLAEDEGWEEVLYPFVYRNIRIEESCYAAPVNIQRVNWLWMNPRVFQTAGIEYPGDWDSFKKALARLDDAGFIPLVMGDEEWQMSTLFENVLLSLEGEAFYRACFEELDPESLGGRRMRHVLDEFRSVMGFVDGDPDDPSWTEAACTLARGEAGMYVMGDWVKNVFHREGLGFGAEGYVCIPFPGTEAYFLNNTDVFIFPLHSDISPESQEALASVIMDRDIQREFNRLKGSVPARTDLNPEDFDEVTRLSIKSVGKDRVLPSFSYRQASPEDFRRGFMKLLSLFLEDGESSVVTAGKMADLALSVTGDIRP
jgi:glucose/mannose transport system substrate-binding protein